MSLDSCTHLQLWHVLPYTEKELLQMQLCQASQDVQIVLAIGLAQGYYRDPDEAEGPESEVRDVRMGSDAE